MALSQLVGETVKTASLKNKGFVVIKTLFYLHCAASFVHKIPKKE